MFTRTDFLIELPRQHQAVQLIRAPRFTQTSQGFPPELGHRVRGPVAGRQRLEDLAAGGEVFAGGDGVGVGGGEVAVADDAVGDGEGEGDSVGDEREGRDVYLFAGGRGHQALDFVAGVEAAGVGGVGWGGGATGEDGDYVVEEGEDSWGVSVGGVGGGVYGEGSCKDRREIDWQE